MKPKSNGDQIIRFGPFELKLGSEELYRDGVAVKLPPQPFKVLVLLTTQASQLVTREEIQQRIWGQETFVDFDKGLNFCIKQIREALGDNAQTPQYIETLPRRGYRFIAPVESSTAAASPVSLTTSLTTASTGSLDAASIESSNSADQAQIEQPGVADTAPKITTSTSPRRAFQWRALAMVLALALPLAFYVLWKRFAPGAGQRAEKIMLAVLPFENLNADAAQDYFSDGLTEEMITQLGRLQPEHLGVIARTTALTYKKTKKDIRQIAQELGVKYVLEGSVRREADRVRITAQLVQVSDQTHLWAETFERSERDMLQIQSEVASRVARALALELLPSSAATSIASKTSQPEAYDAYLKGRYLITKDTLPDFERSIPFFEQAIEKDPNFAPAYVGLVEATILMATWRNTPAPEVLLKAKTAALKAVELDPTFGEAYAALGSVNFWLEWNWKEAATNLKRAIELNPSNPHIRIYYASYLLTQGQTEAGVNQVKQAIQLDPVSLLTNGNSAYFYLRAGYFDDAIAQGKIMLEIEPSSPAGHDCLISAYTFKGMYQEAVEVMRQRMRKNGMKGEEIEKRTAGDAREVLRNNRRQNLDRMKEAINKGGKVAALSFATAHTELGEKDQAFEWLEKSFAARETMFVFFKTHPRYQSLQSDPRFADLARRIGL